MGQRKSWRCKTCLWGDCCSGTEKCSDYTPLDDNMSDKEVERIVKEGMRDFEKAWEAYIQEYNEPR